VDAPGNDVGATTRWIAMWYAPRAAMRRVLDGGGRARWPLAALLGVSQALDQAARLDLGNRHDLPAILLGAAVGGAVAGPAFVLLAAALLRWTGSWLGGRATAAEVRTALTWGQVPAVSAMPLWVPVLLAGGVQVFRSEPDVPDAAASATIVACGLAMAVAAVWGIVTSVACLAEAQRFSLGRALASLGLALFVLCIPAGAVGIAWMALWGR
jgi:hypothetical protein